MSPRVSVVVPIYNVAAYLDRLVKRPSYARALKEAEPFLKYVPM